MSLRIVLADDEPTARLRLYRMLSQIEGNTIVAECRNGRELVDAMESHVFDLVFTDIEMPGMDGFHAVSRLNPSDGPLIVFTTAHPQYAARAFDMCALDYLVKPIESERLVDCLRRADRARLAAALSHASDATPSTHWRSRFFVVDGAKHTFVEAQAIDWIEAADYYACLHASGKRYLVRETIQHLVETLDPTRFVRVHRSAIVNVERVRHMVREGRHGGCLVLANALRVPVSSAYWPKVFRVLAGDG